MEVTFNGEFHLYLNSAASLQYFPFNIPAKFSNRLVPPISLSPNEFEVGIAEITLTTPPIKGKFFNIDEDRKIIVTQINHPKSIKVGKNSDELYAFLSYVNSVFISYEFGAALLSSDEDGGRRISILNETQELLTIPKNLSTVFGFQSNQFVPGTTTSVKLVDQTGFDRLAGDAEFTFSIGPGTVVDIIYVNEPQNYAINKLVKAINDAFRANSLQIILSVTNSKTNIATKHNEIQIQFSDTLQYIFELPEKIELTKSLEYNQVTKLQLPSPRNIICICADFIQEIQVGSSSVKWLRTFLHPSNPNQRTVVRFPQILYHAVTQTFLQVMAIEITDEYGNQYELGDQPINILLKFRPRNA